MIHQTYSRIAAILDSDMEQADKLGKLCSMFMVHDLSEISLPDPTSQLEEDTQRKFNMFLADVAVDTVRTVITPQVVEERLDYAYTVISSYVHDPRLFTPLVILWAAGRMSRMGMEPGLCFTRILDAVYNSERKDCRYDLRYTFRDKDILRALESVKTATLVDPVVKLDFLLGLKQILTYLKERDRDFRKGLTLNLVEKML